MMSEARKKELSKAEGSGVSIQGGYRCVGDAAHGADSRHAGNPGVQRISPLFDPVFLYIFGRSEGSKRITKAFLNALLRVAALPEVERIDDIDADTAQPGGLTCKTPRCDVVVMSDGGIYDIESQGRRVNVCDKCLFYASKLITTHMPRGGGDSYEGVPRVVMVALVRNQQLFPGSARFIHMAQMSWDGEPGLATERVRMVVVEMDKVAARYNSLSGEVRDDESLAWLYLLAKGYESREEMEAVMEEFPALEEFATQYGIAIGDPRLQRMYDNYVEGQLEYNSAMAYARNEGREEGRELGREEGREEGRELGREEGREEGRELGREELVALLRERGVGADVLEACLEELAAKQ